MSITRLARFAPILLLAGCGIVSVGKVTEDNFAEKYAEYTCKQMKECNPIDFYVDPDDLGIEGDAADAYPQGDMDECIDYYTEVAEDALDFYDDADCDFDEEKANECFSGGSCKAIAESIGDKYTEDADGSCDEMFDCG